MTTRPRNATLPTSSPERSGSSRTTSPSSCGQGQRPFFTLFQSVYVCSCPQRHVSRGGKACIRIVPSKTWEQNAVLVRRLLFVEEDDILTFFEQDGTLISPGYDELKDREGDHQVRIMAIIERTNAVELIDRLAKDNAKLSFLIHEDTPIRDWVYDEEDCGEKGRCDCDCCVFSTEQSFFEDVLYNSRMQRITNRQRDANYGRESDSEGSNEAEDQRHRPRSQQAEVDVDREVLVPTQQERFENESVASEENEEEDYHYGRLIRGVGSSGVPIAGDTERHIVLKRRRQLVIPTDEEFRSAATKLRWMR